MQNKAGEEGQTGDKVVAGSGPQSFDRRGPGRAELRNQSYETYDPEDQKRRAGIISCEGLVRLLHSSQPLSASEIRKLSYSPKEVVHRSLKRLTALDLVVKVEFESHTLYALQNRWQPLIHRVLPDLL